MVLPKKWASALWLLRCGNEIYSHYETQAADFSAAFCVSGSRGVSSLLV